MPEHRGGRRKTGGRSLGERSAEHDPTLAAEDETLAAPWKAAEGDDAIDSAAVLELLRLPPDRRLQYQEELGEGGMGSVALVLDPALGRSVAKKVMAPSLRHRQGIVEQFLREARITAQLDHPAIVPVHDLGTDSTGQLYFTMKVVEGETLADYFARLSSDGEQDLLFEAVETLIKVSNALAFAHSRGVVHGDLKPDNVMVGAFGQVYIMDWGLARLLSTERAAARAGRRGRGPSGTPSFMAPEQARGDPIDERTDVFCAGGLLYYLLTGRPPHPGDTVEEKLELARRCEILPPSRVPECVGVPSELESIVLQAMAREPAARHRSMVDLRDRLTRFLRGGHAFTRRQVTAGQHVLREGEEGEEVYYLLSGRAEAYRTVDGERVPLGEMTAGEVFGEMAILTSSRRTASVVAVEDCTLIVVTPEALEQELKGMQGWMAALIRTLARRFREREQG